MKDAALVSIIKCAELEEPNEQDVTLLVGGFLVSGKVISFEKYSQHHPITESIAAAFDEADKALTEEQIAELGRPNFIHLSGAKYFIPGQQPIPNGDGVFARISLSAVHGFHLGSLQVA
ncbi:MAG: hypothetical protein FPO08_14110 [Geobacter sp.]|nr:MAG: hypothetical protein FPO08_14110 [Geobacter sp.]